LYLVSHARDWRAVCVPATGMLTLGVAMVAACLLGQAYFGPKTVIAWFISATPVLLFVVGVIIIASRPAQVAIPPVPERTNR
jgi:hypothetical protein